MKNAGTHVKNIARVVFAKANITCIFLAMKATQPRIIMKVSGMHLLIALKVKRIPMLATCQHPPLLSCI